MELALLTDAYIMISIYDSTEKRVTTFQSHEIEPLFVEIGINAHERFRPGDVSKIVLDATLYNFLFTFQTHYGAYFRVIRPQILFLSNRQEAKVS